MSDIGHAPASRPTKAGVVSKIFFLIQVSRPGLWSTTAMFYLMPLGHWSVSQPARCWIGLFYIIVPLGLILYGVNDIADAEADKYNPRKGTYLFGSLGSEKQLEALRLQISLVQVPFLILFFVLTGPRILWWLALLLAAVTVYNAPNFGWKGRPPFDVLIQASYLLVYVLSSWLNRVPQLPWQTFLFGALFAMHSHVFGEVMDIAPDRLAGRRTTATVLGAVRAKFLIATIVCAEIVILLAYFHAGIAVIALSGGVLWFILDATLFWKEHPYKPAEMRAFMWIWNVASLAAIYWHWSSAALTQPKTGFGH